MAELVLRPFPAGTAGHHGSYLAKRGRFSMPNLGARTDNWHSGNPKVKPGLWALLIIGMAVLAIVIGGLIGAYFNGNGSPYLSHPAGTTSE
jgi:hypothetical protein